jgi:hypothetical protein
MLRHYKKEIQFSAAADLEAAEGGASLALQISKLRLLLMWLADPVAVEGKAGED